MRKYIYFIERTDTNEWLSIETRMDESNCVMAHDMPNFIDKVVWTNDPFKAKQFGNTKYELKGFKDSVRMGFYENKEEIPLDRIILTEHEFVFVGGKKNKN